MRNSFIFDIFNFIYHNICLSGNSICRQQTLIKKNRANKCFVAITDGYKKNLTRRDFLYNLKYSIYVSIIIYSYIQSRGFRKIDNIHKSFITRFSAFILMPLRPAKNKVAGELSVEGAGISIPAFFVWRSYSTE